MKTLWDKQLPCGTKFCGVYFCGLAIFCVSWELIFAIRRDRFFLLGINFCDFHKEPNTQHIDNIFVFFRVRAIHSFFSIRIYFIRISRLKFAKF